MPRLQVLIQRCRAGEDWTTLPDPRGGMAIPIANENVDLTDAFTRVASAANVRAGDQFRVALVGNDG